MPVRPLPPLFLGDRLPCNTWLTTIIGFSLEPELCQVFFAFLIESFINTGLLIVGENANAVPFLLEDH